MASVISTHYSLEKYGTYGSTCKFCSFNESAICMVTCIYFGFHSVTILKADEKIS